MLFFKTFLGVGWGVGGWGGVVGGALIEIYPVFNQSVKFIAFGPLKPGPQSFGSII